MRIRSGFESKYANKANEAPTSLIVNLNKKFSIIFECHNGQIVNVARENINIYKTNKLNN